MAENPTSQSELRPRRIGPGGAARARSPAGRSRRPRTSSPCRATRNRAVPKHLRVDPRHVLTRKPARALPARPRIVTCPASSWVSVLPSGRETKPRRCSSAPSRAGYHKDRLGSPLGARARRPGRGLSPAVGTIAGDDRPVLPRLGTAAPFAHARSRRPAFRVGPRVDDAERPRSVPPAGRHPGRLGRTALADSRRSSRRRRRPTTRGSRSGGRRHGCAGTVAFPSVIVTPHPENNVVYGAALPAPRGRREDRRRAVVVLPQWNSDAGGHVGLCRLLARFGLNALRLSLPYHDPRMPPIMTPRGLHRQRQRRADGAGVPAGGRGRAPRGRVAGAARGTSGSASWARASDPAWRC